LPLIADDAHFAGAKVEFREIFDQSHRFAAGKLTHSNSSNPVSSVSFQPVWRRDFLTPLESDEKRDDFCAAGCFANFSGIG
jgi:hypothetical protein